MRNVRQRAAIWKQYQPRPQRYQAALERKFALGSRHCAGISQASARLHELFEERKSTKGLANFPSLLDF
jgi:hypothetical protein